MEAYQSNIKALFAGKGIEVKDEAYFGNILELVKDRCTLLTDFYDQGVYFFKAPDQLDTDAVKPKWNEAKTAFFTDYCQKLESMGEWQLAIIEETFKNLAAEKNIKPGELQLPMRIMLVGGKFGPAVFEIAAQIGKQETIDRIKKALIIFNA